MPKGYMYDIVEADAGSEYTMSVTDKPSAASFDKQSRTVSQSNITADVNVTVTNTYKKALIVPTGIRLDILPYAVVIVLAACLITLMAVRRRKHMKLS
jgi:hypothetical protein